MACLVTGGTGFIGSYVVRDLLSQGKEVVCLQRSGVTPVSRFVIGEDNLDKVKVVQGDVSDTLQLFQVIQEHAVDLIVHVSYVMNDVSEIRPAYALRVNCIGMNNVLEAARLFGLRKVIWASSTQALGQLAELYKEPVGDDSAIYMINTMYGATKALNECMGRLYFEKFGVDSICLRIGFTLGVAKFIGVGKEIDRALIQFFRNAALNLPATLATTDADRIRALCYVENLSDLIIKACDVPTTKTRTFNAIEYQRSVRQLAEIIRKVNPKAQVTIKEGVGIEEATWGGNPEPVLDTTGVRTELGWKPKYSLEEAVKRIFNYFRQQEGLPPL